MNKTLSSKLAIWSVSLLSLTVAVKSASIQAPEADRRIVLAVGTLLDGRGGLHRNTRIVIDATKIVAIDPALSRPTDSANPEIPSFNGMLAEFVEALVPVHCHVLYRLLSRCRTVMGTTLCR